MDRPDQHDLECLLRRLRKEAASLKQEGFGDAPSSLEPTVSAWVGAPRGGEGRADAIAWKLLWRLGARAMVAFSDGDEFIGLGYQAHLGRAPDPEGLQRARQLLAAGTPRTELWVAWRVSDEAQARRPLKGWQGLATRAAWRMLRGRDVASVQRVLRAVMRRLERWAANQVTRHRAGAALLVAREADARLQVLTREMALERARADAAQAVREQEAAMIQARLEARITALASQLAGLDDEGRAAGGPKAPDGHDPASSAAVDRYLSALEQHFRGDPAALAAQLAQDHLPTLRKCHDEAGDGPCLDIGCGRGVWLSVLAKAGFDARGVDRSPEAVAAARTAGLDAEVDDAVAWLQRQPDASALAVTALHVLEHLPLANRLALLAEAARVLKPNGVLIVETPNPENLWVATHTFHHDPTHTQPLTPEGLAFMVQHVGLTVSAVPRLHPYPEASAVPGEDAAALRLNHMTCGGQDFAIVARKPASASA